MLQTIVLALIQSAAEFLPISSSGHLILAPRLFGWHDQGMSMDIALHIGTLFSVLIYFRRDVVSATRGAFEILRRRFDAPQARLTLKLGVACIPVFLTGFFLHDYIEDTFRSPRVIAVTAIVFGILLYVADKKGKSSGDIEKMRLKDAFLIGVAQVLALIPGVSRSGITMTAARALGVNREEAARFSMLLSVPTIAAAGALGLLRLITEPAINNPPANEILIGTGVAFLGGFFAIGILMRWLKRSSFAVFAIYRIALGIFLFSVF